MERMESKSTRALRDLLEKSGTGVAARLEQGLNAKAEMKRRRAKLTAQASRSGQMAIQRRTNIQKARRLLQNKQERFRRAFDVIDDDGSNSLDEGELLNAIKEVRTVEQILDACPSLYPLLNPQKWLSACIRIEPDVPGKDKDSKREISFAAWAKFCLEVEAVKKRTKNEQKQGQRTVAGAIPIATRAEQAEVEREALELAAIDEAKREAAAEAAALEELQKKKAAAEEVSEPGGPITQSPSIRRLTAMTAPQKIERLRSSTAMQHVRETTNQWYPMTGMDNVELFAFNDFISSVLPKTVKDEHTKTRASTAAAEAAGSRGVGGAAAGERRGGGGGGGGGTGSPKSGGATTLQTPSWMLTSPPQKSFGAQATAAGPVAAALPGEAALDPPTPVTVGGGPPPALASLLIHRKKKLGLLAASPGTAGSDNSSSSSVAFALGGEDLKQTPLHVAAANGSHQDIQILLSKGWHARRNEANQRGETALFVAARQGMDSCVDELVAARADLNQADELGQTPLLAAAMHGHDTCASQLIDRGAEVDTATLRGKTPLQAASGRGHGATVDLLIRAGADPNVQDKHGRSPAAVAAKNGQDDTLGRLLQVGADPDAVDGHGRSPLFLATSGGHDRCVKLLIQAGADANHADSHGQTPAYVAGWKGHANCLKLFVCRGKSSRTREDGGGGRGTEPGEDCGDATARTGVDLRRSDEHEQTPTFVSAEEGNAQCLSIILRATEAADIDCPDVNGRTPVFAATVRDHGDCLRILLRAGANPDLADHTHKQRPLYIAALRDHIECLRLLLNSGSSGTTSGSVGYGSGCESDSSSSEGTSRSSSGEEYSNDFGSDGGHGADDNNGDDAHHRRSPKQATGKPKGQQRSLAAEIDCQDLHGRTPLAAAAKHGNYRCVALLLRAGANPGLGDRRGRIPLFAAVIAGHVRCVQEFVSAGTLGDPNQITATQRGGGETVVFAAAKRGKHICLESLLGLKGVDVNKAAVNGQTPLIAASLEGHEDCVELLLGAGADFSLPDDHGETALDIAARRQHDGCLEALLRGGAPAKDHLLLDAVSTAGRSSCVATLVSCGAKVNVTDDKHRTPLLLACRRSDDKCVRILLGARTKQAEESKEARRKNILLPEEYDERTPPRIPRSGKAAEDGAGGLDNDDDDDDHHHHDDDDSNKPQRGDATAGERERSRNLLKMDKADQGGHSPLFVAASRHDAGAFQCVRLLAEAGADVNVVTRTGWTPVGIAALACSVRLARASAGYGGPGQRRTEAAEALLRLLRTGRVTGDNLKKTVSQLHRFLEAGGDASSIPPGLIKTRDFARSRKKCLTALHAWIIPLLENQLAGQPRWCGQCLTVHHQPGRVRSKNQALVQCDTVPQMAFCDESCAEEYRASQKHV